MQRGVSSLATLGGPLARRARGRTPCGGAIADGEMTAHVPQWAHSMGSDAAEVQIDQIQPRGRAGVVMAQESPESVAIRRHREHEKSVQKKSGAHRTPRAPAKGGSASAREPMLTPKPPPPRPKGSAFKAATARGTTPKTKQEAALAQSLEEWLASLGNGCERYLDALQKMGFGTVYALVEGNPRPEMLKQGGVRQPSCRRRIWQATQRLQTQSNYKRSLRETMEPQLVKARAQARTQTKPRTPRMSVNALHPVPLPAPIRADDSRMSVKEHTARIEKTLGKSVKLELSAAEKLQRQTAQIGKIVRSAITSNRSLNGQGLDSIRSVFEAIDKDGSGELDHDEFRMAMSRLGLGLSEEQVVQCIDVLDTDRDGSVSLEEFMVLVKPPKKAAKAPNDAGAGAGLDTSAVDEPLKLPELPKSARAGQEPRETEWTGESPRRRPKRDRASKAERVARRAQEIANAEAVTNQWTRGSRHSLGIHNPMDMANQQQELRYIDEQLVLRKTERQEEEARRDRYWKEKIDPINKKRQEQQAVGRWDTLLKRARGEQQQMRKEREHARREREDKARELLKDMSYVLEQTGDDARTEEELKSRHEKQSFIDHMTNLIRARRMDQATVEEVRQLHELMLKELFNKFDEDGGGSLDREEIGALAKGIGHKLTAKELDAAMKEMDEDGEGDVDFVEFYAWWQKSKGKSDGPLNIDTSAGGEPFTITIVRI